MTEKEKIPLLYCFLDTNILMEFQTFDEVEWEKLLHAKHIRLVLAPVVLTELDKHKTDYNNTRRQKRARMLLPKLNRLIESGETSGDFPQVRLHVTLLVLPNEPSIDWAKEHLDPSINDDRLLASMLDFSHQHPGEQVLLLSDDSGPRLKAKSRDMRTSAPPEGLKRLADPPSPEKVQIRQLQKQIEDLNNRPLTLIEQARNAIETQRPDQTALIRKYMSELAASIEAITPTFTNNNCAQWDELFNLALSQSVECIVTFSKLAEYIAEMNAVEAAQAIYKGFGSIRNLYTFPQTGVAIGQYFNHDHDVAKFLGYELFVTFFAYLIGEERWNLIANLLQGTIYTRKSNFEDATPLPFHCMESYIVFLIDQNNRLRTQLLSPHGAVLNKRHTEGELAKLMPMSQFVDAEYFLFLRAQVEPTKEPSNIVWAPWSFIYMKEIPRYLKEACYANYAEKLVRPFGVYDIETLRDRLTERAHKLINFLNTGMFWHYPLERFDFKTIGSL